MPERGGGGSPAEALGQLGLGPGAVPPGLLQMAGGGVPDGSGGGPDWAPSWVREQLPANLAAWAAQTGGGGGGGGGTSTGGADPFGGSTAPTAGYLAPWLNPNNWGPPPPLKSEYEPPGGWFPEFNNLGPNPNEKFWSMKAYNQQRPGDAGIDERPNTRNPQYAGAGNFMYLGHPISQWKLFYDTHRPVVEGSEGGEVAGGSLLPYRGWGRDATGWSTKGQVGFPGQLDPFGVAWGGGGGG
jgi:hypothetical protein